MKRIAVLQQVVRLSRPSTHPTKIPAASGFGRCQSSWSALSAFFGFNTTTFNTTTEQKETTVATASGVDMTSGRTSSNSTVASTPPTPVVTGGDTESYKTKLRDATTPRAVARILKQMEEQNIAKDIGHYNAAIDMYGSRRDWKAMLALLEEMEAQGVRRDAGTYIAIVRAYSKVGKVGSILTLLEDVKNSGNHELILNVYNSALFSHSHNERADWEMASSLLQELKKSVVQPDRNSYYGTIMAAGRAKKYPEFLILLGEMKARGFDPPKHVYHDWIKLCEQQGEWEKALEVFEHMDKKQRTESDYLTIIRVAYESEQFEEVIRLFGEMKKEAGVNKTLGFGFRKPYMRVIISSIRCDKFDLARTYLEEAKSIGHIGHYANAIHGFLWKEQVDTAIEILNEMKQEGHVPNEELRASIVHRLFKNNRWKVLVDLHNKMQRQGIELFLTDIDYCRSVIMSHAKLRRFDDIPKLYHLFEKSLEQSSKGSSSDVMKGVLHEFNRSGSVEKAIEILHKLRQIGFHPTAADYNPLMYGLQKNGERRRILGLMYEMKLASIQPDELSYYITINACFELELFSEVIRLHEDMNQANIVPKSGKIYIFVLKACAMLQEHDLAVQILEEMNKKGVPSSPYAYNLVIGLCSGDKNWERARALFEEMNNRSIRPNSNTYNALIQAYAACGRWDDVISTFEEAKEQKMESTRICHSALSAYFNVGKYADAINLVPGTFENERGKWRFPEENVCRLHGLDTSRACPLLWYYLLHRVKPECFEQRRYVTMILEKGEITMGRECQVFYSNILKFLEENGGPPVAYKGKRYFRIFKGDWINWMESADSKRFG